MRNTRILTSALVWMTVAGSGASALEWEDQIVGNTMPGWEIKNVTEPVWTIADGVLSTTGERRGKGWFGTKAQYSDFAIDLEFKVPRNGNSGVLFRVPDKELDLDALIEVQILDDYADKYTELHAAQFTGSLYKFCAPNTRATYPAGQWNRMRITVVSHNVQVILNGVVIVETEKHEHPEIAVRSQRGMIGFQNYGDPVQFRNIKLADIARDREQRSRWFRDAKFGMFIHWGIYSLRGEGEWVMHNARIPAAEYEKLAPQFNPVKFNAAEWVGLAKRAGQKYMVITSKHHDGFAMFETKSGPYNIIDATPYKRDPMKDLAAECGKQGVRFAFYYSALDWHHPDFVPFPDWDVKARESYPGDFAKYLDFMQLQIRELCTNYGPIAVLWYDGGYRGKFPNYRTRMREINDMAHTLQPQILINNRSMIAEDFVTPEQFVPPTGIVAADGRPALWESCITIGSGWGYEKNDTKFKSAEYIVRMLVDIVSKGGNLLLNVGPSPEGTIGPNETRTLEETGRWLEKYGDSIYGTTANPFRYLPFHGRCTVKGNTLYPTIFTWPKDHQISLPGLKNEVRGARLLGESDTKLQTSKRDGDVVISLPDAAPHAIASVIVIDLDSPPAVEPFKIQPAKDGTVTLPPILAELHGKHGICIEGADDTTYIAKWNKMDDFVTWEFTLPRAGKYEVNLAYSANEEAEGGTFLVFAAYGDRAEICKGQVTKAGGESRPIGNITLPAGKCTLAIRPTKINKDAILMNVRNVVLKPLDAAK